MYEINKQRVFIAVFLMVVLFFGAAVSAEARDNDTNGSDRLVKGAAIGAAVGAVTQVVRGRTQGKELLKGAAVGATAGAAVGAYSDYKQEKNAREDERRRADYYEGQAYRRGAYRDGYSNDGYNQGRGRARRAATHHHSRYCGHR